MEGNGAFTQGGAHELRYLFIDFNAFFASVEQHDEPRLRGHPVIVTPLQSEHSGAIAASYEAKALGIERGTAVQDARRYARQAALWYQIDSLNRRYGKQTIALASQAGLDLNYLGVKIAFSRVPEAEEIEC